MCGKLALQTSQSQPRAGRRRWSQPRKWYTISVSCWQVAGRERWERNSWRMNGWTDGHFNVPTFPHCRHRNFSPLWLTEKSCRKVSSRLYLQGAECLVFQNYRELRGSFLWLAGDSESFIYWLPRGPHSSQSVWSGDLKIKHVPRVFVAGCKNSPSLLTRERRLVDTVYEPARVCARACAPWKHHHMQSSCGQLLQNWNAFHCMWLKVVTFLVMCNLSAICDTRKRVESTSRPLSRALIKKAQSQTDIISLIYTRNTSGYCFMSKALHLAQGQIR